MGVLVQVAVVFIACCMADAKRVQSRISGYAFDANFTLEQADENSLTVVHMSVQGVPPWVDESLYLVVHELQSAGCWGRSLGPVYQPRETICRTLQENNYSDCTIGDLSGRWGRIPLSNQTVVLDFKDPNLPLFGRFSLIGRSLGLWAAANVSLINQEYLTQDPLGCAELRLADQQMQYARAHLGGPLSRVSGTIIFSQPKYANGEDTTIGVTLKTAAPDISQGHKWSIHEHKTGIFSSCNRVGNIFEPTLAKLQCNSSSSHMEKHCTVGALSLKHGTLSIPTRSIYTDSSLPLSGEASIIGRSLVLHAAHGGERVVLCGDISDGTGLHAVAHVEDISDKHEEHIDSYPFGAVLFTLALIVFLGICYYNGLRAEGIVHKSCWQCLVGAPRQQNSSAAYSQISMERIPANDPN